MSFLLFPAFVFSSFSGFCLFFFLSNLVRKQLIFFKLFIFIIFLLCLPLIHAFLSSSSLSSTHINSLLFFAFLSSTLLPLTSFHIPLTSNYQDLCHTYFSSLLGPSMDLELDFGLSASLYISFLRISATCCVSWTNRLFGKASPMNGFNVSLPATV